MRRVLGPMSDAPNGKSAARKSEDFHPACGTRIFWQQPRPGFHYPLSQRDVLELLESVGSLVVYGLHSIEFTRCGTRERKVSLTFGRYEALGRIFLFEQPLPPWRLRGRLAKKDVQRFERAGALVSQLPQSGGATLIDWPADTLRRFMLEQVLLHELGHHVLQYHKGKRLARIARTKDHEAFAALFAQRQRSRLVDRKCPTE